MFNHRQLCPWWQIVTLMYNELAKCVPRDTGSYHMGVWLLTFPTWTYFVELWVDSDSCKPSTLIKTCWIWDILKFLEHDGARMVFLTIKIFHIKCLQLTCLIFCARVCYDLNKKRDLTVFHVTFFDLSDLTSIQFKIFLLKKTVFHNWHLYLHPTQHLAKST